MKNVEVKNVAKAFAIFALISLTLWTAFGLIGMRCHPEPRGRFFCRLAWR